MAHAVDAIDFDLPLFVFDKLFEIGLGFLAVGLAREFGAFGGLWCIDAKHSDAEFGLVGRDHCDCVAVGDMSDGAFLNTLRFFSVGEVEVDGVPVVRLLT
jgi:hypothetical protein